MSSAAINAGKAVVTVELKNNIDKGVADLRAQLKVLSRGFTEVGYEVTKLGFLISGVLGGALAALKFPIQISAQIEKATVSFEVLTGSAMQATTIVKELRNFAAKSPLTFQGLNQATETLLAYGVASKDVIKDIKALGAVSRGDQTRLERLALAYGQVAAKGKLYASEVRQFTESGFNPLQQISKDTGQTIGELMDKMEKGGITFNDVRGSIIAATTAGGRFFGLMEKQAKTLEGLFHQLSDAVKIAIQPIGDALAPALKAIMGSLMTTTKNVGEFIRANQAMVPVVVGVTAAIFVASTATAGLGLALLAVGSTLKAIQVIVNVGSQLAKGFTQTTAAMTSTQVASSAMATTIVTTTTEAAASIGGLSKAVVGLVPKFTSVMSRINASFTTGMAQMATTASASFAKIQKTVASSLVKVGAGATKLTTVVNASVGAAVAQLAVYGVALEALAAKVAVTQAVISGAGASKTGSKRGSKSAGSAAVASAVSSIMPTGAAGVASAGTMRAASTLGRMADKTAFVDRNNWSTVPGYSPRLGNEIRKSVSAKTGRELNMPSPTMTGMGGGSMVDAVANAKKVANPQISAKGWEAIVFATANMNANVQKALPVVKEFDIILGKRSTSTKGLFQAMSPAGLDAMSAALQGPSGYEGSNSTVSGGGVGFRTSTGTRVNKKPSAKTTAFGMFKKFADNEAKGAVRLAAATSVLGSTAAKTGGIFNKAFGSIGTKLAGISTLMLAIGVPAAVLTAKFWLIVGAVTAASAALAYVANRAGVLVPVMNEVARVSKEAFQFVSKIFGGLGKAINLGEFKLAFELAVAGAKLAVLSLVNYVITSIPTIVGNISLLAESLVGAIYDIVMNIPQMIMSLFSGGASLSTMIGDIIMGRFESGEMKKQLAGASKEVDAVLAKIDASGKAKDKAAAAQEATQAKEQAVAGRVKSEKEALVKADMDRQKAADSRLAKMNRDAGLVSGGVDKSALGLGTEDIAKNQEKSLERLKNLRDENKELELGKTLYEDRKLAESGATESVRKQIALQLKWNETLKAGETLKDRIAKLKEETFAMVNGTAAAERAAVAQQNFNGSLDGLLTQLEKATATKIFTQNILELQDALTEEVQGKDAAEQIKLRRQGLNNAQIGEIANMQKQVAAAKAKSDADKQLIEDANALKKELRTPLEIFREEQARVAEMQAKGLLDVTQATKAFTKNIEDLQDALNDGVDRSSFTGNLIGSAAEREARQRDRIQIGKLQAGLQGGQLANQIKAGANGARQVNNVPRTRDDIASEIRANRIQQQLQRANAFHKRTASAVEKPKKEVRFR